MIETIASRLSHQIILLQVADKEDEEIIAFGLFHIISVFQQTIILAFIAYVLKLYEIAAFTIAFTSLKRYIGGYHAHKHWLCITYYTAFSSISCLILKCMPIKINTISLLSVIAALVFIVFMKAPVTHPNNRKSKGQLNRLRG